MPNKSRIKCSEERITDRQIEGRMDERKKYNLEVASHLWITGTPGLQDTLCDTKKKQEDWKRICQAISIGCTIVMCFLEDFKIYFGLGPFSGFPRCV